MSTLEAQHIKKESSIPRIIRQIFIGSKLPTPLAENVEILKQRNPTWQHQLWSDQEVHDFITEIYGKSMLDTYLSIDASYGAARADLFRYLLMYKEGGVYLDIKSNCLAPLDDVVRPDDQFLLCQWQNTGQEERVGFGLWKELREIEGGEFQQWQIVSAPGHPFLEAVIEQVVKNIHSYTAWSFGTGQLGNLRMSGPIAYTLAIEPIRNLHPHRRVRANEEIGLVYKAIELDHTKFYKAHHLSNSRALVNRPFPGSVFDASYRALKFSKKKMQQSLGLK